MGDDSLSRLSTKQNDFVARILDDCRSLEKRVDEEEQRLQLIGGFEMREPEDKLERQMRRIKQEREVQEAVEEVATYQAASLLSSCFSAYAHFLPRRLSRSYGTLCNRRAPRRTFPRRAAQVHRARRTTVASTDGRALPSS